MPFSPFLWRGVRGKVITHPVVSQNKSCVSVGVFRRVGEASGCNKLPPRPAFLSPPLGVGGSLCIRGRAFSSPFELPLIVSTKTKRAPRVKPDLYQVITNKVITLLEAGTIPWQRPWNQYGLARNYASGHVYTGINAFLLNFFPSFDVPFYLTYKQAQALGGQVRKGAKAETVYFFKTLYKDADGKSVKLSQVDQLRAGGKTVAAIPMPRTFHLFNIADIDGIDFDIPNSPPFGGLGGTPIQAYDDFVAKFPLWGPGGLKIIHQNLNQAFYTPATDVINMPPLPRFHASESYYHVLLHEITHSTGHASRLDRPGITLPPEQRKPQSETYAFEELVAELGAVYLCQHAGILDAPPFGGAGGMQNTAAYIDGYLHLLKDDKRFLFQASSQAQKAVNFLLESSM